MKIAICLSGQPRWYKECYSYFKKNIIDNFENVDVFIHCWKLKEKNANYESSLPGINTGVIEEDLEPSITSLYKPVSIEIENPIVFKDAVSYQHPVPENWPANNVFSMFYSMKKCILLKKEKEEKQNFKYDWVFRSRFDYAINRSFNQDLMLSLDDDTFYSPHVVPEGNIHCHGDFNFATSKVIDCLGETFDNLLNFGKKSITLVTESMTYEQIKSGGFQIKEFDLFNQFPPNKHSACWHSLWGHR